MKAKQEQSALQRPKRATESTIQALSKAHRPKPSTGPISPPDTVPGCAPPDIRTPPSFVVPFRRNLLVESIPLVESAAGRLTGVAATDVRLAYGLDLHFEQIWNLLKVKIGDMSSTIALAPAEELTLEFQSTQRRVLEQSTVDSAEAQDQTESTILDKEVMSVTRSSSRNHSWHVDGSGSLSLGKVGMEVGGGVQDAVTQTTQAATEHITEATRKSAHSLKTLHKIEVRGVSETVISNRMTRTITNPYRDRTLVINVFQLVKQYSVGVALAKTRAVLTIDVDALDFDEAFVASNTAFLTETLLDEEILDQLPAAQQAMAFLDEKAIIATRDAAKLALHYLFDDIRIFGVPPVTLAEGGQQYDANHPSNSFDAFNQQSGKETNSSTPTGLGDAIRTNSVVVFTTLNLFYRVYEDAKQESGELDARALTLALALDQALGTVWTTFSAKDEDLNDICNTDDLTEPFRRVSGFLALMAGTVRPLLAPAEAEAAKAAEREKGRLVLAKLDRHLHANMNFYVQRFLNYAASKTKNQAIIDFVNQVIDAATLSIEEKEAVRRNYDIERAFVDRQQIVIPAFFETFNENIAHLDKELGASGGQGELPSIGEPLQVIEVEVPSDGIHLEVAAGSCILTDLPPLPNDGPPYGPRKE